MGSQGEFPVLVVFEGINWHYKHFEEEEGVEHESSTPTTTWDYDYTILTSPTTILHTHTTTSTTTTSVWQPPPPPKNFPNPDMPPVWPQQDRSGTTHWSVKYFGHPDECPPEYFAEGYFLRANPQEGDNGCKWSWTAGSGVWGKTKSQCANICKRRGAKVFQTHTVGEEDKKWCSCFKACSLEKPSSEYN